MGLNLTAISWVMYYYYKSGKNKITSYISMIFPEELQGTGSYVWVLVVKF
jgi:hypothetical protein